MNSLQVSKVVITIPTEEAESFSPPGTQRDLIPSQTSSFFALFLYEDNEFKLPISNHEQVKIFKKIIHKSRISAEEIENTLIQINKLTLKNIQSNSQDSKSDELSNRVERCFITISVLLYVVFFIFIIVDAYYIDDIALTYVGVILLGIGMVIQIILIFLNGNCLRFRRNKKEREMEPALRNQIMNLLVYANRNLETYRLKWRLDRKGKILELHLLDKPNNKIN